MFAKAAITGTLQAGTTAFDAEYLVVAGGGGCAAGGGGAGGFRTDSNFSIVTGSPYTVTVGAGGSAATSGGVDNAGVGADSVFASITSAGGGNGGGFTGTGGDGGSGGGTSYDITSAGGSGNTPAVTPAQGFDGGSSNATAYAGAGGGGGAGGAGQDATTQDATTGRGGNGGLAKSSTITGSTIYYAGGGGGGGNTQGTAITGGGLGGGTSVTAEKGGAADGATARAQAGSNAAANTGGGAGGAEAGRGAPGGAGGSGVVIIRVPSTVVAEFSAGVVYNYIPLDDFNVYEITAAGVSDTVTFSQGAVTTVGESLRFNDDDSAYLARAYSASQTNTKATLSFWYKLGSPSSGQMLYQARDVSTSNNLRSFVYLYADQIWVRLHNSSGVAVGSLITQRLFRDSSAWYHIVVELDTTKATASERMKLYINGVKESVFTSEIYPALNFAFRTVSSVYTEIGRNGGVASEFVDGYMSDVYFIDGQALDPSRFGKQDADGVWQPITYTGTYGTNGFHLDFADNSTAAALGTDVSGNGNDWTPSGITTDDQVTDTPSVNYATWNPLDNNGGVTLSNGNLDFSGGATAVIRGTMAGSGEKFYWEITNGTNVGPSAPIVWGIANASGVPNTHNNWLQAAYFYTDSSASSTLRHYQSGSLVQSVTIPSALRALVSGDVLQVAYDGATGKVWMGVNDVWADNSGGTTGDPAAGTNQTFTFNDPSIEMTALREHAGVAWSGALNCGQRPFAYTPPTGFQALNSANLPAPTITDGKEHFDTVLYTGNGASQTVRGLEFQPDFLWFKSRTSTAWHLLVDAVRGNTKGLASNVTDSEYTTVPLLSFLSNGVEVNHTGTWGSLNSSGNNIVAWNWNAGGSTVTNTDGTITSQVRANTDAGISIVSYTGNSTENTTYSIGHGLSETPDMVIIKNRDWASSSKAWPVWHSSISTGGVYLDNIDKSEANNFNYFFATQPNSTTFSVRADSAVSSGNRYRTNGGYDYIAYCFHSVDGFSKFGSYTGNGSADGPFVYTGFRPAFVLVKQYTSSGEDWYIHDGKRNPYNPTDKILAPNTAGAEPPGSYPFDFVANGFKIRTSNAAWNASGEGYIFMAFAENPFKTSRAR